MRIIIHVGLPKTGSSALQQYLYDVREAMPKVGFAYPDLDNRDHWKLAAALMPSGETEGGKRGYMTRKARRVSGERDDVLSRVREILQANADGTVILSHENFSTPAQMVSLSRFLEEAVPGAQVHVVAYVRDPVSFYPSGVQQVLKNRRAVAGPAGTVSRHPQRVKRLQALHGEALVLRAYRRDVLVDGDIVEDFREVVRQLTGAQLPESARAVSTNTSLPGAACALLQRANQQLEKSTGSLFTALRRQLTKFSEGRNAPKLALPAEWAAVIAARNHVRWNALIDQLQYPAEIKDGLKLQAPDGEVPTVTAEDAARWIDSYFDPEFTAELVAYVEGAETPVDPQLVEWLRTQTR